MKEKTKLLLLFSLMFFAGCSTTKSTASSEDSMMNSWMGSSKAQLLQVWGPPTRVTSDGQEGEILVYDQTASMYGMVLTRSRCFYVNKNGKIYYWMCKGREGY